MLWLLCCSVLCSIFGLDGLIGSGSGLVVCGICLVCCVFYFLLRFAGFFVLGGCCRRLYWLFLFL